MQDYTPIFPGFKESKLKISEYGIYITGHKENFGETIYFVSLHGTVCALVKKKSHEDFFKAFMVGIGASRRPLKSEKFPTVEELKKYIIGD